MLDLYSDFRKFFVFCVLIPNILLARNLVAIKKANLFSGTIYPK